MVQLCDLEAMEQIHVWRRDFEPELVVPYATRNETIAGTTITADGAAFRSHDEWYGAGFKCRLSRDGNASSPSASRSATRSRASDGGTSTCLRGRTSTERRRENPGADWDGLTVC
jgi:hypothetical protein